MTIVKVIIVMTVGTVIFGSIVVCHPDRATASGRSSDDPASASEHSIVSSLSGEEASINRLTSIISESRGIIAAHPRGETPFAEIVIWASDHHDPGQINESEILIISHSRALRTITGFRIDSNSRVQLSSIDLQNASFCDAWRTNPDVQAKVIATDIDDMQLLMPSRDGFGERRFRIQLKWPSELSDVNDSRSIVIDGSPIVRPLGISNGSARN